MGEGNWFSGPSPICPFPETIFQYDETPLIDLWSPYIEGNKIAVENWKIKQTLRIVVIGFVCRSYKITNELNIR